MRSFGRRLAIKCNVYKRKIVCFEMNFARRGRGTKRRKRNFPSKEKGVFWSVRPATCNQIVG